jgi:hypothetical protein
MAAFVLTSESVTVGDTWTGTAPGAPGTQTISGTISSGDDLAAYVTDGVTISWDADMQDTTNMASGGYRSFIAGLSSGSDITLTMLSDFASSKLHAIITALMPNGIARPGDSEIYIDVKPTSSSRGSTNPSYVMAVLPMSYTPFAGAVGDKAMSTWVLKVTGAFGTLTS